MSRLLSPKLADHPRDRSRDTVDGDAHRHLDTSAALDSRVPGHRTKVRVAAVWDVLPPHHQNEKRGPRHRDTSLTDVLPHRPGPRVPGVLRKARSESTHDGLKNVPARGPSMHPRTKLSDEVGLRHGREKAWHGQKCDGRVDGLKDPRDVVGARGARPAEVLSRLVHRAREVGRDLSMKVGGP